MSDWLQAEDYTTLEQVFASPDFTRDATVETFAPRAALLATAASVAATASRPFRRSLRDLSIATVSVAAAAASMVGAIVLGSGPVAIPFASAPPSSQVGGTQSPAAPYQHGFAGGAGSTSSGGAGASSGAGAKTTANTPSGGVVYGPALPSGAVASATAAGGSPPHASMVADTFPAPTTTTTTPPPTTTTTTPPPTTTTTTAPPLSGAATGGTGHGNGGGNGHGNGNGNGHGNGDGNGQAGGTGHDNGGGNGNQNNGHGNEK